jgi:diguanylate cyclase (GGDEF)-like protein
MDNKDLKKEEQPLVLIVDDVPKNLQVLGTILSKENYRIAAANNGEQAIAIANDALPDLILLDIMMPGLNGYETCTKLKSISKTKEIPVVFLTAKIETEDVTKGFKAGAVDYVTKPFNSFELLARVKTHVELKTSRDLLKEQNELLQKLSITDRMTGLYNHQYIIDSLSKRIAESKRYKQPLSVAMIDIDFFKKINDGHGHAFGDHVLIKISSIIEDIIRKTDMVGRYGGEEFLIIFTYTDLKNALKVTERIRESIEKQKWDKPKLKITVSGGIDQLKDEDASEIIIKTDNLLYKAKENGRNRIEARV